MQVSGTTSVYPFGCCDFQLLTGDNSIICGRSLEFPISTESVINVQTRGEQRSSLAPDKSKGVEWVSKYGFVGINALGLNDPVEGMNERGLSIGGLTLTCSEYQNIAADEMKQALGAIDTGAWILGNFSTVEEVKAALPSVKIWGNYTNPFSGKPMGLHLAIHDASGKNLVIEFIDGEVKVYENPIGVLTNDPPFPFHLQNLRQFNYLNPNIAPEGVINGYTVPSFIEGDSMHGLPGDWSSISRFIRVATVIRFAVKVETAIQGVNLAEHVLNVVDRPMGTTIVKFKDSTLYETTRWVTIKNLTDRIIYYRSYDDMALRGISLAEIDFSSEKKYNAIPVSTGKPTIIDMTKQLFK